MTTRQPDMETPSRLISGYGKIALLLATALALLATPMVSPAMHDIAQHFGGQMETDPTARALTWMLSFTTDDVSIRLLIKFILLSIPALMIVVCSPLTGLLSDYWGRRKLLIYALILFAISGMSGYFVNTLTGLFIGRLLLGASIAAIKTLTVAMVGDYFLGKERDRFIGWQGSAMKFGGVAFLLLGGYLAEIHWRIPFWGYALAFVALPGVIWSLADVQPGAGSKATGKPGGVTPATPILAVSIITFSAFLASVLFFMTLVQLPFYMPEQFPGRGPKDVGIAIALANLVGAAVAIFFYRLKARLSYPAIFSLIFLVMGCGYAAVALAPSFPVLLLAMAICGCAFGMIVPAQSAWMLATVSNARRGFGIGLVTTGMFLGQFAAPMAIEPFIDPANPGQVFQAAAIGLVSLAAIYAIAGTMLRRPAPSGQ